MEAPLHHSPVPMPAPAPAPAPPRQHDGIGAAAVLQQAAAVSAVMSQKPPPPPLSAMGREQCPRCASRDTKFCYYNNYNTAQPRHFCRACRRYWTLGGSLRNVPVGGSTRRRPRPARGPTRAALSAAVTTASSSTGTTTTTASSYGGPCFGAASPVAAPAPATAQNVGLLNSLLLGSAPLLEGRLGFDLGLGQPAGSTGPSDLAQLGFGAGPLLWPATVLEGDRATETTWKSGGALFPPAAALWQEPAAAMPAAAGAGAPQLLL